MKVKQEHYEILKAAVDKFQKQFPTVTAEHYNKEHLSPMRYRWDVLYICSDHGFLPERFISDVLYKYCNDDHIDTALRKITNTPK